MGGLGIRDRILTLRTIFCSVLSDIFIRISVILNKRDLSSVIIRDTTYYYLPIIHKVTNVSIITYVIKDYNYPKGK